MRYLLDTCVISELVRPQPDPEVVAWVKRQNEMDLNLSVITLGEIEKGIGRLPASARRKALEQWLREDLAGRFAGRLVTIDAEVACVWGRVQAELELRGKPMGAVDGLLSATARVHDLMLVTRNNADFHDPAVRTMNPWGGSVPNGSVPGA
ncbi:MAG: type II toxin-antitoxin system VapC family toxin [Spirochaetia bacterium]